MQKPRKRGNAPSVLRSKPHAKAAKAGRLQGKGESVLQINLRYAILNEDHERGGIRDETRKCGTSVKSEEKEDSKQ